MNYLPDYHEQWGGAERACYRLIKSQIAAGHKLYVAATRPTKKVKEDFEFFEIPTLEDFFGKIFEAIKRIGIPFDPISFFKFYRLLKKIKPDVVHFHNFRKLSFSMAVAAKLLNLPTVLSVYDYWYFCLSETLVDRRQKICRDYNSLRCWQCEPGGIFKFPLIVMRRLLFNYFLRCLDAFVVLSQSSVEILVRYGIQKTKIFKIPITMDLQAYQPIGLKNMEEGLILYVGWVQPRKGLDIIIQAMPQILSQHKKAHLVVAGALSDKAYEDHLRKMIKDRSLDEAVSILGKVETSKLKEIMTKANLIVIPEQWENMSPVVLIESMAYAKPVVASCIGGIPEFISDGETGFLAEPKNPSDFAQKVIEVLSNKVLAERMGEKARVDILEKCDQTSNLKKIFEVYHAI